MSWRAPALAVLMALPAVAPSPAMGQSRPAAGVTISDTPVQPGTRTVCVGQRRDGVRTVGCFDVYRLEIG
ncbi:MAG TPA: hypothetical protein VGL92_10050, partial [Acidimicrobiia bacterium]